MKARGGAADHLINPLGRARRRRKLVTWLYRSLRGFDNNFRLKRFGSASPISSIYTFVTISEGEHVGVSAKARVNERPRCEHRVEYALKQRCSPVSWRKKCTPVLIRFECYFVIRTFSRIVFIYETDVHRRNGLAVLSHNENFPLWRCQVTDRPCAQDHNRSSNQYPNDPAGDFLFCIHGSTLGPTGSVS